MTVEGLCRLATVFLLYSIDLGVLMMPLAPEMVEQAQRRRRWRVRQVSMLIQDIHRNVGALRRVQARCQPIPQPLRIPGGQEPAQLGFGKEVGKERRNVGAMRHGRKGSTSAAHIQPPHQNPVATIPKAVSAADTAPQPQLPTGPSNFRHPRRSFDTPQKPSAPESSAAAGDRLVVDSPSPQPKHAVERHL